MKREFQKAEVLVKYAVSYARSVVRSNSLTNGDFAC